MMTLVLFALVAQTTWREAAPLLDRHCNSCHRAGQVGPFDFTAYEGASAYAPEIQRYIEENKMPPWREKVGGFSNSKALPASARAGLLNWAKTGAAEGSAAVLAKRHPQWNLGEPSLVLTQPREHTVSAEKIVDIVRFEVPVAELGNADRELEFEGFELRPSNRNLLHHAVLLVAGQPIAAWAMCDNGVRLPAGVAWRIPKGQPLTVELHYFKRTLRPARDLTRVALYYPKAKAKRVARLIEFTKPSLRIPAGARQHRESAVFAVAEDLQLHAVLPVFQLLSTQVRLKHNGKDLLWVEPYEHHVMTSYVLARPMVLVKGSRFEGEASYDNSAQNPFNPHQTLREVKFEENGLDETFRFWLTVSQ